MYVKNKYNSLRNDKKVGSEVEINLHELWKQIEEQSAEHSEKQENN